MTIARREFLRRGGALLAAGAVGPASATASSRENDASAALGDDWMAVRNQFALSEDTIHMSAMLLASHPRSVRDAIEQHRRKLDADPVTYLERNNNRLTDAVLAAAAEYLNIDRSQVALTDSTTMGVGLVYNGLRLSAGDEILSTDQDYYVTHESIRLAAERSGARVRKISLFDKIESISAEAIVTRIVEAVRPETRALALTWVHSSTGLKLPLRQIADAIKTINAKRDAEAHILICVDGVHGFGVEDASLPELGCDFLMAGCHKWLFGPRGTGIVAGTKRGWNAVRPTIPSFIADSVFSAWIAGKEPPDRTTGRSMSPGGFKPYEHRWSMKEAFDFHKAMGKSRVGARTHALARQLKDGLAANSRVKLHTPRADDLSAGIVAFDVEGLSPEAVVSHLRDRHIIASVSPYARPHVRLTPSVRNTPGEIDAVLTAIEAVRG